LISGHDTGPGDSGKKYRPLFLDHFDKKEAATKTVICQIPLHWLLWKLAWRWTNDFLDDWAKIRPRPVGLKN